MINSVLLIGRLGKDPDKSYTKNGTLVVKFTLATSKKYKTDGEVKENTTWHNIKVFGKSAEACDKYICKGSQVYVEGSINNIKYTDKNTNQEKYFSEVIANKVLFMDRRKDDAGQNQEEYNQGSFDPDSI